MDEEHKKLRFLVRTLAAEEFGLFFDLPIKLNSRLKRTLGRIVYKKDREKIMPLRMELSPVLLDDSTRLRKTILHELAHWYLMINGKDYKHRSAEFKNLSNKYEFDRD
ncbi:MAG: SprT-like domain-containing protein [Kosmotogaceae bacterium]